MLVWWRTRGRRVARVGRAGSCASVSPPPSVGPPSGLSSVLEVGAFLYSMDLEEETAQGWWMSSEPRSCGGRRGRRRCGSGHGEDEPSPPGRRRSHRLRRSCGRSCSGGAGWVGPCASTRWRGRARPVVGPGGSMRWRGPIRVRWGCANRSVSRCWARCRKGSPLTVYGYVGLHVMYRRP